MSQCRFNKPQLDLSRRPEQGPWLVDMQSFFELSFFSNGHKKAWASRFSLYFLVIIFTVKNQVDS